MKRYTMSFQKSMHLISYLKNPRHRKVAVLRIINPMILTPKKLLRKGKNVLGYVVREILPNRLKTLFHFLLAFKDRKTLRVRRFLHPRLSLEDFFKELKKREIEYVILRWFDEFPQIQDGEDIDILISNQDLYAIDDLFGFDPRQQAFDIYSVSGVSGTDYKQVPYYPPHLAQKILASRRWIKNLYAVPDPLHHFFSLAYHVVFHKGESSGIPNRNYPEIVKSDHDYMKHLKVLAKSIGIQASFNDYISLFEFLEANAWTPEFDTMRILAREDHWLQNVIPDPTDNVADGEIMVFVVREWAILHCQVETIISKLEESNLDVLALKILDRDEKERATRMIRGGKWDRGPHPVSGGPPCAMIVCYDYHPISPSREVTKIYPYIKNGHVLVKHKIRDYLNAEKLAFFHTNPIHSADDEYEAWLYIQHVLPSYVTKIRRMVEYRQRLYHTEYPVLQRYESNRSRAKIEKINYNGISAVKKTFKPGKERFAQREAFVYENFGKEKGTIPPLLEKGVNYIIIPWYDDVLKGISKKDKQNVLKPYRKAVMDTMRMFFDHGFALIGFYPGNLLMTSAGELKIIDFEFLYEYKNKPDRFSISYDIVGVPKDFDGDRPLGSYAKGHTYNNTWKPIFGPANFDDL